MIGSCRPSSFMMTTVQKAKSTAFRRRSKETRTVNVPDRLGL